MRFYIQEMNSAELRSQMGPGASDVAQFVPELRQLLPELETSPILEPSPITLTRLVTRVLRSWTVSPGTRFDAAEPNAMKRPLHRRMKSTPSAPTWKLWPQDGC